MNAKKLYFRNEVTLANISAIDSQIRLFGATWTPLGQLSSAPEKSCLLATDEAHSILGAKNPLDFQAIQYSAYGHSAAEKQATALGYNGELLETFGFYLLGNGNRAYSTHLMRFLSPDKIGVFSGTNFNEYAYTAGDPINRNDPSGNIWKYIRSKLRSFDMIAPEGTKTYKDNLSERQKLILKQFDLKADKNTTKREIKYAEDVKNIIESYPDEPPPGPLYPYPLDHREFSELYKDPRQSARMLVKHLDDKRQRLSLLNAIAQSEVRAISNINNSIRRYEHEHPKWKIQH